MHDTPTATAGSEPAARAAAEPAALKRILFVDDEQSVLDGIRRLLRGQHREWDLQFALGGQAALDCLDTTRMDVVVSDMRMPGMDGAALLTEVRARQPHAVRIILSGYSDRDAALRAVPVAHQFLTKPCDPQLLKQTVTRACSLQALLSEPYLREALGKMDGLPSRPQMYDALTRAVADPDTSLGSIVEIVEQDAGMCVKVLQLVNSAFFGMPRPASDIRTAISCIGVTTLQNLVLTTEVFRGVGNRISASAFEAAEKHAVLSAQIARRLIDDRKEGEQAFLAGLLHDVGTLLLAAHAHTEDVAGALAAGGPPDPALHARVGGYLLALWGLPYPISEAVANHHQPSLAAYDRFDLVGAVHVADVLAREQYGLGPESKESFEPFDTTYLERVGAVSRIGEWREIAARTAASGAVS